MTCNFSVQNVVELLKKQINELRQSLHEHQAALEARQQQHVVSVADLQGGFLNDLLEAAEKNAGRCLHGLRYSTFI